MLAFDSVIMLLQGRAGVGSSGHLAAERLLLSGVARRRALVVLLVGFMGVAPAGAQSSGEPDCVRYPHTNSILPNGYPFDAYRAVALFRFHRQDEAIRELDAGRAIIRGPWRWRIPPDQREELSSDVDALRNCLAATEPPELATLTVRVIGYARDAANNMMPLAGARVYVEGLPMGRTDHSGALTVRVPLSVTLEAPPSNPALPVSNIEVGTSLAGAGMAIQGVSDANGQFEIESLPSGVVDFECVTVFDGGYYYGEGTLVHSGPGSATLILRGVEDVINGVAPLRVGARVA